MSDEKMDKIKDAFYVFYLSAIGILFLEFIISGAADVIAKWTK